MQMYGVAVWLVGFTRRARHDAALVIWLSLKSLLQAFSGFGTLGLLTSYRLYIP